MKRTDERLTVCEEMYLNLTGTVASLRLEVNNFSSFVYLERPSKPPSHESSTEPATLAPVPEPEFTDSFVIYHFSRNRFSDLSMRKLC